MSMFGTDRDVDAIAEYADASVRVMSRRGSLAPISGRHGFNEGLYDKWGNRGNAVYTFVGGLLTIALSGALAWALDEPLVFPSLGATAFLFFETPMAEVASPRNTIIGHYTGALVAYGWLLVFGSTTPRARSRPAAPSSAPRPWRCRSAARAACCACCAPPT